MVIYKATNKKNGKIYIGQTIRPLKTRIACHFISNIGLFSRALRKYGTDGFDFEIIEKCLSKEELNQREIYWISFFGCVSPCGYNLTQGGENPPSQLGKKRSAETKAKLKGRAGPKKGCVRSKETREKMAISKIGNKHSLGFKMSDESKLKKSIAMKGRVFSEEHKKKLSEAAKKRMKGHPMPWAADKRRQVIFEIHQQ